MSPSDLAWVVGAILLLAAASAFFSGVETALFILQPTDIERLKARKHSFSAALTRMLETPRRLVSAILLGEALSNVPLIVLGIALLDGQNVVEFPFWASALIIFTVLVFLCDLIPKLIGLNMPYQVARIGVTGLRWMMPLLDPVARVLERGSERLANAVTPEALHSQRHLSGEELETLVELSAEEGTLHETESEMISEIIKLGNKTAKDCMTPRVDAFALSDDLTNEEAMVLLRQKRFRRVPVYGETPDDIEGVLDVGEFLRDPSVHYTERLDVPSFVPETMPAPTLLKSFLNHPQGLAIVVDEHGGVEGIVTMADVVEEIISDAVPLADAKLYLESIGPGRLLANGNARLEDIGEELGAPIEEEGIDTIGGLIFTHHGQLPRPGTELTIGDFRMVVRRVSRKRVEEVLVVHEPSVAEQEEEEVA